MMYVPVLLSAVIVEELELIWVCCGWRVDTYLFKTWNIFTFMVPCILIHKIE
jgi:hypothetical protein